MVLLFEKFGNVSNNLFQHIHFNSFCKENNIEFINMTDSYLDSSSIKTHVGKILLYKTRKFLTSLGIIKLIDFNEKTDVAEAEQLMKTKSIIFCKGWNYRNFELTKKDRHYYHSIYTKNIDPTIQALTDKNITSVGIHIRRGDYEQWENGKYFYNDDVYFNAIKRIKMLLNVPIKIFIFSNDTNLNTDNFRKTNDYVYISKNDIKSDHYLMSVCNYIIGPPSSFSMWASYIGNTKFYHIKDKNTEFNIEDFEICNG